MTLNDVQFVEAARVISRERMMTSDGDSFDRAPGPRLPPVHRAACRTSFAASVMRAIFTTRSSPTIRNGCGRRRGAPGTVGESARPETSNSTPAELASWTVIWPRMLLNLDETLNRD